MRDTENDGDGYAENTPHDRGKKGADQDVEAAYANGVRCVMAHGETRSAETPDELCGKYFDDPEDWITHVYIKHGVVEYD